MAARPGDIDGVGRLRSQAIEQLIVEGSTFVDASVGNQAATVSTCPGWTVDDLVGHLGRVHSWVARCLRSDPQERISFQLEPPAPRHDRVGWYHSMHRALVGILSEIDLDRKVASGTGPVPASFWLRRQGHETSIHRWDLQNAVGTAEPIHESWALDGIDEACEVFVPRIRPKAGGHPPIGLNILGHGPVWLLTTTASRVVPRRDSMLKAADISVSGSPSDLLLWLWGRPAGASISATGKEKDALVAAQTLLRCG